MGNTRSHLLGHGAPFRLVMNGLEGAGKTSILYKLRLGKVVTTEPTIGMNVETVEWKSLTMTVWDVGGQDVIRPLFRASWYCHVHGLIFVVDSNDDGRIRQARENLMKILSEDELRDAAVLIFANKQDLPDAMSVEEISDRLALWSSCRQQWHIQESCALTGLGLLAGLDWLSNVISGSTQSNAAPLPVEIRTKAAVMDKPGTYCVAAKNLEVLEDPAAGHVVGRIPRGTAIVVEEVARLHTSAMMPCYGRIKEPITGWVPLFESHVQSPDFLVTLHAVSEPGRRIAVSCVGLSGNELALLHVFEGQTVAGLRTQLAEQLGVGIQRLKLLLADGRLLSNAKDAEILGKALWQGTNKTAGDAILFRARRLFAWRSHWQHPII